MNNRENDPSTPISPSSLKQKLKSSFRLSWLGHRSSHHDNNQSIPPSPSSTTTPFPTPHPSPSPRDNKARLSRISSNNWLKSPEIKEKCRNLINRIGNGHGPGHRHSHSQSNGHVNGHNHGRRHSADFRYDPSSYALNFDKGMEDSQLDEFPYRNFTARLPPSPSPAPSTSTSTSTSSTSRETKVLMKQKSVH